MAIVSIALGVFCIILIWVKLLFLFLAPLFIIISIIGICLARSSQKRNRKLAISTTLGTIGLWLNIFAVSVHTFFSLVLVAIIFAIPFFFR